MFLIRARLIRSDLLPFTLVDLPSTRRLLQLGLSFSASLRKTVIKRNIRDSSILYIDSIMDERSGIDYSSDEDAKTLLTGKTRRAAGMKHCYYTHSVL